MPWQLIYTSAPRGLISGQSGFCTVARSPDLRESLAQRLEQISSYHYLEVSGTAAASRNPTISAYRILDIRGTKFHALTRIQPCGLDFTARTNHLAQHLVFAAEELAQAPSPAAVLRDWDGWIKSWQGEPRMLESLSMGSFSRLPAPAWPARAWQQLTGDAGRAAGLLEGEYAKGAYLLCRPGGEAELLDLFCETLQLSNWTGRYPLRAWQHTFTTFIQGEDVPGDFEWRGCQERTPAWEQAVRRAALILQPATIRAPVNPLAKFAREGPKVPVNVPAAAAARAPVTLRRDDPPKQPLRLARRDAPGRTATQASLDDEEEEQGPSVWERLNSPAVKGVGIALILLLSLAGIKRFWLTRKQGTKVEHSTAGLSPGPAPSALTQNTQNQVSTPSAGQSQNSVPSKRALQELDNLHWQDAPVYVVTAPNLAGPINLGDIGPLNELLRRFDEIDLKPKEMEGSFNVNNWGFPIAFPMKFSPRGGERRLAGIGQSPTHKELKIAFDYPRRSENTPNQDPVQLRVECAELLSAFSLFFRPAADSAKPFRPFRLLVVNESRPPGAIELNRIFVGSEAQQVPQDLTPPLTERLPQLAVAGVSWRLRPYIGAGAQARYLYDQWKADEKPPDKELFDVEKVKGILAKKLQRISNAIAEIDKQNSELAPALQPVNFALPVGHVIGLTNNPELASLESFTTFLSTNQAPTKPRRATALSPDLFLRYLDQLKEKSGTNGPIKNWEMPHAASEEGTAASLEGLYKLFSKEKAKKLTIEHPSSSNYFLATWKKLKAEQKQNELQQRGAEMLEEEKMVRQRADELRLAYRSLCLELAPERWLEALRFSADSPPTQP